MKILMVTTAFYPEQAIGSVRMSGIAKYADASGHDVSIISLTPPEWARKDESLYFARLNDIDWKQLPQSPLFSRIFSRFRKAVIGEKSALSAVSAKGAGFRSAFKAPLVRFAQFLYTFMKAVDWSVVVLCHVRRKTDNDFDIAITSYPSLASPFAGILLKKVGIIKRLHVDFRDPVVYGRARFWSFSGLVQRFILRNADMVTGISKGVIQKVSGKRERGAPSLVIPNGYDQDLSRSVEGRAPDAEILSFCYVGSMYGGQRDLSPLFEAIGRVAATDRGLPVRLHYAGNDWDTFRDQCTPYISRDSLINHGLVSRDEALRLQKSSDVCLLATWNTVDDQGILTGKMFEFFMLRKPVLAVVNGDLPGSETRAVIDQVDAGFCFEEAQSDEGHRQMLDGWLDSLMEEKQLHGVLASHYNAAVERYSFENLVGEMLDSQKAIVEGKV